MEKMWSKINGAYDQTVGGNTGEGFLGLNGNPTQILGNEKTFGTDGGKLFGFLDMHDKKDALISASSLPGSSHFRKTPGGIARSHAYTVLSTHTIQVNGRSQQLIKMRNPWSKNNYNGTFSDKDSIWNNAAVANQLGGKAKITRGDGVFYIPPKEFLENFRAVAVGYNIPGHVHSQVESQNDDNKIKSYTFTLAKAQKETFVNVLSYNNRMYPNRCGGSNSALVRVYDPNGRTLKYTWVNLGGAHYTALKFDSLA